MYCLVSLEYVNARGEQIKFSIGYGVVPRLIEALSAFGRFF